MWCWRGRDERRTAGSLAGRGSVREAAGWPLLADPLSGARRGEAAVAHYDALLRDERSPRRTRPDLVLRVGDLPVSKPLRSWLAELERRRPGGARPRGRLAGPGSVLSDSLALDPARPERAALEPAGRRRWRARARGTDGSPAGAAPTSWPPRRSWGARRATASREPAVAAELGVAAAGEATLFVASSMPVRDIESFWPVRADPPRVLCNRGANGIDGTVSSAFGAAAAGGPVVLLIGDVALAHDIGGLLAARRLDRADDRAARQRRRGDLRLPAGLARDDARAGENDIYTATSPPPPGLDFARPPRCTGWGMSPSTTIRALRAALERALAAAAGSTIVEARTDRARQRRRCTAASGSAVSRRRSAGQQRQQRLQLDLRLGQLGRGLGVAHDAVAGVAARDVAAQQRAAQRHAELAVAVGVGPADGARVPAAVEPLERRDQRQRDLLGGSPPTAGVGCISPASSSASIGAASWARIGVARCWMFAICTSSGSGAAATQTAWGAACARSAGRRSRALRGSSRRAAAARRGGRRPPGRRCDEWSRPARACSRGDPRGAPAARGWRRSASRRRGRRRTRSTTGTASRRTPEDRRRVIRGAGACDLHLAGQHDLLQRDRPRSARSRVRPPPRSARAASRSPRGSAPRARGRAAAAVARAAPPRGARGVPAAPRRCRRAPASAASVRLTPDSLPVRSGRARARPPARPATPARSRPSAGARRHRARRRSRRRPPGPHRSGRRRIADGGRRGLRQRSRQRHRATALEAIGDQIVLDQRTASPRPASATPAAVGLLEREPRLIRPARSAHHSARIRRRGGQRERVPVASAALAAAAALRNAALQACAAAARARLLAERKRSLRATPASTRGAQVSRASARDRDLAGAHHLDQPERADHRSRTPRSSPSCRSPRRSPSAWSRPRPCRGRSR